MSACLVAQLCLTLCYPMNYGPPGSLSMEFPRQEYWSGLPFLSPGDLLDLGIESMSLVSPAFACWFFTVVTPGKAMGNVNRWRVFWSNLTRRHRTVEFPTIFQCYLGDPHAPGCHHSAWLANYTEEWRSLACLRQLEEKKIPTHSCGSHRAQGRCQVKNPLVWRRQGC